jgi:rhomboid family GlyGly-CTERM serine protease
VRPSTPIPAGFPEKCCVQNKWLFCLVIFLVAFIATGWPDGLVSLRYDRIALINGEIWRLLTAHLVHLNWAHCFLNLFGLLLICELLWRALPLKHGIGLFVFSGLVISACLWWLNPELASYAGLSGVLHGLWAGCVLFGLLQASEPFHRSCLPYWIGVFLLIIKLLTEFLYGPSEFTTHLIGGNVVGESHLYGALAGAIYMLMLRCVRMAPLSRGALQQK